MIIHHMKMSVVCAARDLGKARCQEDIRDLGRLEEHKLGLVSGKISFVEDAIVQWLEDSIVKVAWLIEERSILVNVRGKRLIDRVESNNIGIASKSVCYLDPVLNELVL